MVEYRKLSELATRKVNERVEGLREKRMDMGAIPKQKGSKKGKKDHQGELELVLGEMKVTNQNNMMDGYASEDSEPMALDLLSKIDPAPGFKPVVFIRKPLGAEKEEHNKPEEEENESGGASRYSRRSMSSFTSYKSAQQEKFSAPKKGITYPPMAWSLPQSLSKRDPTIIGMSEIYINRIDNDKKCMICQGRHKMYRCNTMLRAGILERWYIALSKGVCLHCLYPRHSSFTCKELGACNRCGKRHNSILCPSNPRNQHE